MNYVEQSLGEGEVVQDVAHKHWIIFVMPMLQLILACVLLALAYKISDMTPWLSWAVRMLGYVALVVGLVHGIGAWLTRITTELAVTNRKVIGKWGIVARRTIEQRLEKVDSIEVEQSIWGRILGYGTVEVRGSGLTMTPIRLIADPLTFRRRVEDAINLTKA